MEARAALCCAKGRRESKAHVQTPSQSSHRRKTAGRGPFPGACGQGLSSACTR